MVYHRLSTASGSNKEIDLLVCHHCGYQSQLSSVCPSCQQPFLKNYGLGTQRVEIELQKLFPQAKIIRLDSDIAQKKGAHEEVFQKFASQQADVLIGTQMIAKGLDNANVTLVGIIAADAAFNLSDYRCTERGFQLLTQVAGRAGRGHLPGKVIVQTFNPDLPALKFSLSHDYQNFYDAELPTRQSYLYPPFSQLIRIVIAGIDLNKTIHISEKLTEALSNYLADAVDTSEMTVLGPAPCLLERLHGKYRQHLIVKNTTGNHGRNLIVAFFKNKPNIDHVQIAVDMDAIDLL
jgi:primosomal protein N' (replication factor Y)